MSVIPEEALSENSVGNETKIPQFLASKKVYVQGSRPDLRVPMRKISLSQTRTSSGSEDNGPVFVYDTSGPYTDRNTSVDLLEGLGSVREQLSPSHPWKMDDHFSLGELD